MKEESSKFYNRLRAEVQGRVQGVGFRPCVYRVAKTLDLTGFVFNHTKGVTIEVQGEFVKDFIESLLNDLPPLAQVDSVHTSFIPYISDETEFLITKSSLQKGYAARISSDVCICGDCLKELFDPTSRYYRYPFLNCTNCGPRYTIIRNIPYDRSQTTMDKFPLCHSCYRDYVNPENRRYHAQPTACLQCGPKLSMSVKEMVEHIIDGRILAIKGQGGYQLVCDARNEEAISELRRRKRREAKPFAIMVVNIQSVKKLVECNIAEEALLTSRERPIVLLRKKGEALASSVASRLSHFGIMLPYTPLHYLLFNGLAGFPDGLDWLNDYQETVLIVTSANLSNEPLIISDQEAKRELVSIADYVVSYDRDILIRADDSVVQVVNDSPCSIRRARGYVPECIKLNYSGPSILALGGQLKNTFCITRGNEAFVSQYIGGLDNPKTIQFFQETLDHLLKILDVKPEYIAYDKHPDFYTTQLARTYRTSTISVQHHHAHLATVAAEHHITEPVLGLALDGYGYGENGEIWGGELLLLDEKGSYQRLGNLKPLPQIGGDTASQEPWRMAAGVLHVLGYDGEIKERFVAEKQVDLLISLLEKGLYSSTSSCGRLFDAASALLGVRYHSRYEAQAAVELESLVTYPEVLKNGWQFGEGHVLDLLPTIDYLRSLRYSEKDNLSVSIKGSNIFHGTLSAALADWLTYWCKKTGIKTVLLGGGCFLNRILTKQLIAICKVNAINPLLPRQLPFNDSGLSLGQAWVVAQKISYKGLVSDF